MWLQDQGIDDNNHGVVRVRQARELSEDGGGVGRGQGIRDASEGWIQRRMWRGLDNGSNEYTTAAETSEEEDRHEDYYKNIRCLGGGY